jgi:hypothetical protein
MMPESSQVARKEDKMAARAKQAAHFSIQGDCSAMCSIAVESRDAVDRPIEVGDVDADQFLRRARELAVDRSTMTAAGVAQRLVRVEMPADDALEGRVGMGCVPEVSLVQARRPRGQAHVSALLRRDSLCAIMR